ncbi:MAG: DUF2400 domain-containing protein [Acidobacteria bacterium]|nr:DUF2400 domain-containing protein [Acidobacteriota bacterium]MDW7984707.1 DUF2400 family protein [Acidobacteriota bacterium]
MTELPNWRLALETLARRFPRPSTPRDDPLAFAYRYDDPQDRTVVAYLASFLAFGHVRAIYRAVESLLDRLGSRPSRALIEASPADLRRWVHGWRYRFIPAEALYGLLAWIRDRVERWGSLEAYFRAQVERSASLRDLAEAHGQAGRRFFRCHVPDVPPVKARFLFPVPPQSACKRLALFIRWVTRRAPPDLGLWDFWPRPWVFVPIDTHLAFLSRLWGWTDRRATDWVFMEQVASILTALCPEDPLRYDYAITHLGISRLCHRRPELRQCGVCPMRNVCPYPTRSG